MRRLAAFFLAFVPLGVAVPALADVAPSSPIPPGGSPDRGGTGIREHDGFYLRLGLGPGFSFGSVDAAGTSVDVKGVHVGTELALGTTLAPGLVVGGGSFSMVVPAPKYEASGTSFTAGTHHVSGVGPFVDYYRDPHGGLHLQGALLLSGAYVTAKDGRESAFGVGFGAMIGAGYEVWIGDQWSVGPVFRLAYYRDKPKGSDTKIETTLSLVAPTLLVGLTYH